MIRIGNITISGNNISIINGVVSVDGVVQPGKVEGIVKVEVTGDLKSLTTDAHVIVHGNVEGPIKAGGSVNCENVGNNISAGGSVKCADVKGNVSADGSVKCADVKGNVSAGGSVSF